MSQTDTHLFAAHAPPMRRVGYAVVPAGDKVPIRRGCGNWCSAPGLRTVAKWAEKRPDAEIVYVPGLSHAKPGSAVIVVVDADEPACEQWEAKAVIVPPAPRAKESGFWRSTVTRQFSVDAARSDVVKLTETAALDDAEVTAEDFAASWGIGRTTVRERLSCAPTGRKTRDQRLTDADRRVPP
jgi:hypothetical protein